MQLYHHIALEGEAKAVMERKKLPYAATICLALGAHKNSILTITSIRYHQTYSAWRWDSHPVPSDCKGLPYLPMCSNMPKYTLMDNPVI